MVLAAVSLAGFSAAHALDLTPIHSFRELEGFKVPIISFQDGLRQVEWQPPRGWQLSGGDAQLNLYPANTQLAAMQLKLIAHDAAQAPDSTAAREDLLKWAAGFVAGDATDLAFDHEAPNPFILGGKGTRELTFNYVSVAKKCTTSIALVNLDAKQSLAVVITASAEDFPTVHGTGTKSMFRWDWVNKPLTAQDVAASNAGASKPAR
jgi:hypothetical protein